MQSSHPLSFSLWFLDVTGATHDGVWCIVTQDRRETPGGAPGASGLRNGGRPGMLHPLETACESPPRSEPRIHGHRRAKMDTPEEAAHDWLDGATVSQRSEE